MYKYIEVNAFNTYVFIYTYMPAYMRAYSNVIVGDLSIVLKNNDRTQITFAKTW